MIFQTVKRALQAINCISYTPDRLRALCRIRSVTRKTPRDAGRCRPNLTEAEMEGRG